MGRNEFEAAVPGQARLEFERRLERRERLLVWLRRVLIAGLIVPVAIVAGVLMYDHAMPQPSAAQRLEEARALEQEGRLHAAIAPLKAALQQEPDNTDARWLLADIYLTLGQGGAAYEHLMRLQELSGQGRVATRLIRAMLLQQRYEDVLARLAFMKPAAGDATVYLLRGWGRLGLNRVAMAKAAFSEALRVDARNAEAHRGFAAATLAAKDTTEALRHIDIAIELDPADSQNWVTKGAIALHGGDAAGAQAAFEQALARNPISLSAAFGLIQLLLDQQKTDAASRYLLKVLDVYPDLPWGSQATYYYLAAQRDLAQGTDLDAAEATLSRALRVGPEHPPSLMLMGWVKLQQGDLGTAANYLGRHHDLRPDEAAGTRLLVEVLMSLGQPSHAVEVLIRAGARQSGNAQLVALLADAYQQTGNDDKAQEMLRRAVGLAPDSVPLRTRLAASLIDSGEVAQGLRELAAVLTSDPNNAQAEYLQALALFRQGNDDGALAKAATLAEKRPADPRPELLIAHVFERRRNTDGARDAYHRVLERDPRHTDAMTGLARLTLEAGDVETAGERFRAVLQLEPGNLPSLNALARMALDAGQPGQAVSLFEQARDTNPDSPLLRLELSNLYARQGRALDALDAARQASRLAPDNPRVRLALGQTQLAAGQGEAALETLRRLVAGFPASADAHLAYAEARLHTNDAAGARVSVQRALELAPDSVPIQVSLAELDIRQGRYDAALDTARKIQQDHPAQAAGYLLEGDIILATQPPAAAVAVYETALERDRTWAVVRKLQAVYRSTGEPDRGDDLVRDWLQAHPHDLVARVALAEDLEQRGEPERAIQEFERALQYQPDNWRILIPLARLNGRAGEPEALDYARRAYQLLPDDAQVQGTYGWLLAQREDPEQGLTLLEAAVRKDPDNPELRYDLAATLALTGKRYRAREELETLLGMAQDVINPDVLQRALADLQD